MAPCASFLRLRAGFRFPIVLGFLTLLALSAASAQSFNEYPLLAPAAEPSQITVGPDGNLWFTQRIGNRIGRVTPGAVFTDFRVPTVGSEPNAIAAGPDGNLWFTEYNSGMVGRITPTGTITEFQPPCSLCSPSGITSGPDGNLWFAEGGGNIARLTTAGMFTEFPVPTATSGPNGIVTGPDGALWFTEITAGKIGRITTAGAITEFSLPDDTASPQDITSGPDGNLWFVESAGNQVGRITTAGVLTEFPIPTANSFPQYIATGPDGNLWFTETIGNNLGRITTAGVINELAVPTADALPFGIVTGPDGSLWFTELNTSSNAIGRLTLLSFIVTNTNDTGAGSLRQAILDVSAAGGGTVQFAIPGAGVQTIQPLSELPDIQPVAAIIDGYTQPGASANTLTTGGSNAVILIALDGSLAGSGAAGLTTNDDSGTVLGARSARGASGKKPSSVRAAAPTIRGLAIGNFDGDGIDNFVNGTAIEGCFIGTNAAGKVAAPNNGDGVYCGFVTIVGGTAPAQRNLISGNVDNGLELSADGSVIRGNLIGTDSTGTAGIPNGGSGVDIPFSSVSNKIGGASAGAGNVIAFNAFFGVNVACGDGCGSAENISGNSIFSNAKLGITLDGSATPLANDDCDSDLGGNGQQNYPVVTAANTGDGYTMVAGTLNSVANNPYRVEFFASPACDPTGSGEGQTYLGFTDVTTNDSCTAAFSVVFAAAGGLSITATATDSGGNTSEFSACFTATTGQGPSTTALTSAPNPSTFGGAVTLTATVTGSGPIPTGTVTFRDGAGVIGTALLNGSGVATFVTSTLGVGAHILTATYGGDGFYAPSTSPAVTQTVGSANTLVALMSSVNPSSSGQPVTFTAVVSPFAPAAGVPTGTVTFYDGAALLGSATLVGGQASFSTAALTPGVHSITAVYSGDATFTPSTSAPLSQTVGTCQKPSPVSDLSISTPTAGASDTYELRWSDVLGSQAGQYEILVSTNGGASFQAIGYTRNTRFASSPTQPPGTVLTFMVRAEPICSVGESKFSDPGNVVTLTVTTSCARPAAPTVTIDKPSVIPGQTYTLTWNSTLTGLGQYRILQSVNGGAFVSIGSSLSTSFSATAPEEPEGTTIALQVRAEPSCATTASGYGNPSAPVTYTVAPGCVPPDAPTDVTLTGVDTTGPPTPTTYLAVTFTPAATGGPATRYGVRINGDDEVSTSSPSAILLPRGERLDPITAFVRAYGCNPEQGSATAQSPTVTLLVSPPIANFTASPSPRVGSPVTFTDTSSPQATSWLWVFDDGATDPTQSPTHTFSISGPHTVYLIASNGAGSSTKALTLSVGAAAAASQTRGILMTSTSFDESNPERRRANVHVPGEGTSWLRIRNLESSNALLFLRFLDSTGKLMRERSLTVAGGAEARYDLGAYGLSGEWTVEIVSAQKFEASVAEPRRPDPKEVHR